MEKTLLFIKPLMLSDEQQLAREISEIPGVDCVYWIGGLPPWTLVAQITSDDVSYVGRILINILQMPEVEATNSTLVWKTFMKGG